MYTYYYGKSEVCNCRLGENIIQTVNQRHASVAGIYKSAKMRCLKVHK